MSHRETALPRACGGVRGYVGGGTIIVCKLLMFIDNENKISLS